MLCAIAVAIKIDSTGPVFFVQERAGKNGKAFLAALPMPLTLDVVKRGKQRG